MRSKLIAFFDNPFMEFHYRPLQGQVLYIFSCQPQTPVLAETASISHKGGRPERLRHDPVPVFLRSVQLREQPLTAIHDELKILDDRRLIGKNPRRRHVKSNSQPRRLRRCAVRPDHDSSFRFPPGDSVPRSLHNGSSLLSHIVTSCREMPGPGARHDLAMTHRLGRACGPVPQRDLLVDLEPGRKSRQVTGSRWPCARTRLGVDVYLSEERRVGNSDPGFLVVPRPRRRLLMERVVRR